MVVWDGYEDAQGKNLTALIAQYNKDHPDVEVDPAGVQQRPGAPEGPHRRARGLPARRGLHVRVVGAQYRQDPAGRRHVQLRRRSGLELGRLLRGRARGRDRGRQDRRRPALVDNLAIVYNKTLFKEAGVAPPTPDWTWDDFRAAAKKLTDPSKKQYGWLIPADGTEDTVWHYDAMLWEAGGDILNSDNTRGCVQLRRRGRGADDAAGHGRHRQVGLPRHHQRQRDQADEQRQDRDDGHRAVGPQLASPTSTTACR